MIINYASTPYFHDATDIVRLNLLYPNFNFSKSVIVELQQPINTSNNL